MIRVLFLREPLKEHGSRLVQTLKSSGLRVLGCVFSSAVFASFSEGGGSLAKGCAEETTTSELP